MDLIEIREILENKDYAEEYFPGFVRPDFSVVGVKSVSELEKKYQDYLLKYFRKFGEERDLERYHIQRGYDYLSDQMKTRKDIHFEHPLLKDLFQTYERCIFSISQYHFLPQSDHSVGAKQNKANRNMMLELSAFRPFVIGVLEKIDRRLSTMDEDQEVTDFDLEIAEYAEDFASKLEVVCDRLNTSEENYHKAWNERTNRGIFTRYATSNQEVGAARKAWRLEKNAASHELLMFFKELNLVNTALNAGSFQYDMTRDRDILNQQYEEDMEIIKNSPNYYSYLDENTRKSLDREKTYQKKKARAQQ